MAKQLPLAAMADLLLEVDNLTVTKRIEGRRAFAAMTEDNKLSLVIPLKGTGGVRIVLELRDYTGDPRTIAAQAVALAVKGFA